MMARDTYSIIHFPMLLGVIAYAATVETALGHPTDPLGLAGRMLLAASVLLYAGAMALALTRAGRPVKAVRQWIPIVTAAAVFGLADITAMMSLVVVLIGLTLLAIGEPVRQHHHDKAHEASAIV